MKELLEKLKSDATSAIEDAKRIDELEKIRLQYFGKKGELTQILKGLGKLPKEERPVVGSYANEVREKVQEKLDEKIVSLKEGAYETRMEEEYLDVTLDTAKLRVGHRHPLLETKEELEDLFVEMGFTVVDGPEIESVENNFDALNSPKNHPSRDKSDTFYIDDKTLLRTHTSPMQIRAMKQYGAPLRIVSSGRVFRFDDVDDTHSPMFHQFEGLVVDKGVSLANLIDTLNVFVKEMFGDDMQIRYRPHNFPFTEPSAEVDVTCLVCHGEGCPACNNTGWSMELLGAGVVHPNVLRNCGIDPDVYSGFAFGMGIDRIAMVKYGITDIRLMFENDDRFLSQF
ncbi:MAG: phenylalanine--tRNA ligase subunit alpha [Peptoniphilus sp.]|nr:phenylalanine--tRNA ligase subunit alpha [Peptoniphilus sp.]MDY3118493.1 phenylalanine--tRNA ligase subunit alpha [Peptoniphilus sp.]